MNNKIEINNVNFSYDSKDKQLKNVNLSVADGECCVIVGASGCGKSTLTRLINGLIPSFYKGKLSGDISLDNENLRKLESWEISLLVGNVFQDPRSQFFANEVAGEVAFACENAGLSHEEIVERVHESAKEMNINNLLGTSIYTLSYGMRQRVAICSAKAMHPDVYVFDEPSANLDLQATYQFGKLIEGLKSEGKTIVIVEHRLFYLKGLADKYVFMKNGEIVSQYRAKELEKHSSSELNLMGLRSLNFDDIKIDERDESRNNNCVNFELKNISKKYSNNILLDNISFKYDSNEIIALIGANGVGKSTLGKICSGLSKESQGSILLDDKVLKRKNRVSKVWYIPQDLDSQLFGEDLVDEIITGMKNREDYVEEAENILKQLGLYEIKDRHPSTLSGGQKQRLVLGVAMIRKVPLIILDEPTSGLDFASMEQVAKLIKKQRSMGTKFLLISHDLEFIAKTCERIIVLEDSKVKDDYYLDDISKLLKSAGYKSKK